MDTKNVAQTNDCGKWSNFQSMRPSNKRRKFCGLFFLTISLFCPVAHGFHPGTVPLLRFPRFSSGEPIHGTALASTEDSNSSDTGSSKTPSKSSKDRAMSALSRADEQGDKKSTRTKGKKRRKKRNKEKTNKDDASAKTAKPEDAYSSLLPPPSSTTTTNEPFDKWEKFLGAGAPKDRRKTTTVSNGAERNKISGTKNKRKAPKKKKSNENDRLPSIQDLFPVDLSPRDPESPPNNPYNRQRKQNQRFPESTEDVSKLEGVLPVSELFYRSSDAGAEGEEHDDEELPFSAEQSDALSVDHNKIHIRRNLANQKQNQAKAKQSKRTQTAAELGEKKQSKAPKPRGRKVVRRGMEMLVGGVPINPDPPQRSVQLIYEPNNGNLNDIWASTISLNTREFGPLLHDGSIPKVTDVEKGLFCEHFVHSALKWDICPEDLCNIVENTVSSTTGRADGLILPRKPSANSKASQDFSAHASPTALSQVSSASGGLTNSRSGDARVTLNAEGDVVITTGEFSFEIGVSKEELESGEEEADNVLGCVICQALMSVLEGAAGSASDDLFNDLSEDFVVEIPKLALVELDDGLTHVTAQFKVEAGFPNGDLDIDREFKKIASVFTKAMDEGDIALAIADAAKEETRWLKAVRDRVVEECLFQDDDDDEPSEDLDLGTEAILPIEGEVIDDLGYRQENLSGILMGDEKERHDELFLSGGNDGVFFDYSESNALNSPYGGEIGLRLVDAMVERAKQRQPRVLAIGDVHGCIDELQDLLRQCDYQPGDLVVFLGDLVCKGPDSLAVVQMAREIGAIGVRGNHDFEVIRWHQAIKAGVDLPVVSSTHYRIASRLSKADMKWMYSLPWFISSKELGALFVHAGFVSGIRLKKQNPRLMMNMRSILPDGTVTSKFFNNWPWARLWDGPQTVLFGHDADRGLQQYEHAIGLDTGCVYGGRLTACILPEKRLVSVNARRKYFKHRRKHYT